MTDIYGLWCMGRRTFDGWWKRTLCSRAQRSFVHFQAFRFSYCMMFLTFWCLKRWSIKPCSNFWMISNVGNLIGRCIGFGFLSCWLICAALPNLFSGSLSSLRVLLKITIIILFIRGSFQTTPPPPLVGVEHVAVSMHKFGRSKHEIYYKSLVFFTYHWSCYFGLKVVK